MPLFNGGQKSWQVLLVPLLFNFSYDTSGQKSWQIFSSGQKNWLISFITHMYVICGKVHCWPLFAWPTNIGQKNWQVLLVHLLLLH